MVTVVGIRFKKAGKIYYFDPGDLELKKEDNVIVETARGLEYGKVVIPPRQVDENEIVQPLRPVLRLATEADKEQVDRNVEKEKQAFSICQQKIAEHGLPMKLIDVEFTFDVNKVIFYFTADGRVDFRELVKDLAAIFRTRIELRQIGVRDETKMVGGLGCCGRPVCCSTFMGEFAPVSIRMAKEQNLSLNPSKISGLCGRLMCCLHYENEAYEDARRRMPECGAMVRTPEGCGRVTKVNLLKEKLTVEIPEQGIREFPLKAIRGVCYNEQ
ncbi:MAG: hypothetical protein PWP31_1758 [Clostridia bacterium]|nr:hypothetical protein [Clostridia bacterium]